MKKIISSTILVLLTLATLSTAAAQEYTPAETMDGMSMMFAIEHDGLTGCPASGTMFTNCVTFEYSTLFMTRSMIDRWFREFYDVHWMTAWSGDEAVVSRVFTMDAYPGVLFAVGAGAMGGYSTLVSFIELDE